MSGAIGVAGCFSYKAKQAHIQASSSHNLCTLCPIRPDFLSRSIFRDHYNSHHYPCDSCTIVSAHPTRLQDHQDEVHVTARIAGDTSRTRITCACTNKFTNRETYTAIVSTATTLSKLSGMMIHFEHGCCGSGINMKNLNNLVDSYRFSHEFIFSDKSFYCPDCHRLVRNPPLSVSTSRYSVL